MPSRSAITQERPRGFGQPSAEVSRRLLAATPLRGMGGFLERFLLVDHLDQLCIAAREQTEGTSFFAKLLKCLDLSCECPAEDLRRIPSRGPVVIVANHPFGLAEGPTLGSLLLTVRRDIRFLANSLLATVAELRDYVIPVDPFEGVGATQANWRPMREAIQWVRGGGLLVVFPAGEVSSLQLPTAEVRDGVWNEKVARLVRLTGATVVPIFFHGANSATFHVAGLVHPRLRTILLPRELLNKRGKTIRVSIGGPIRLKTLSRRSVNRDAVEYLRGRTQLLEARRARLGIPRPMRPFSMRAVWKPAPIIAPVDPQCLRAEVEQLPAAQMLLGSGEYAVYLAQAQQIPKTLLEIARLREIAFRAAGEGTGSALDLDIFDARYHHLFVWNQDRGEIVGAYRLAGTDAILSRFGSRGLYTSTLFQLKPEFLSNIDPGLELGRSFVRPEYQKSYLPLLLLWRGIGQYLTRQPRYRILFGPVSISKNYSPSSRALMVAFLKSHCRNEELASLVEPRCKFRVRSLRACDPRILSPLLANVEELSEVVADLEQDGKGVPVLLRHYLNVGGKILDFSVDGNFSGVVDGLIVVDLGKADRHLLERYMGKAGAERFSLYHRRP